MIIDFKKKRFTPSPTFILDRIKVVSIAFLVLVVGSYLFIDMPLLACFQMLSPGLHEFFRFFGTLFCPMAWILISVAAFFHVRFVIRREKKSRKIWYVSLVLPLAFLACKILSLIFGRATTEWFFLHQEAPFRFFEWSRSFHSFPSMTSTTIMAFATALSCVLSKFRLPLIVVGFLLSLFPVLATDGFLSDSLFGIYVGSIIAQWIFQKMRREISF